MLRLRFPTLAALFVAAHCSVPSGIAAQAAPDADALAKDLSNPVSDLISVPFQFNVDSGYSAGGERWFLNFQPVAPMELNPKWNLISRTILPIVHQSDVINDDSQSGLGDVVQSLFFSPKATTARGRIWGVGPVFLLPTATDELLGAEQWGVGPTIVVLRQSDSGWTTGLLANHLWSVAGDDERANVNATFLQPFIAKALGKGRTITLNLEDTYDWESEQWTAPVNAMYSKVTKFGQQIVSVQGGVRAYLDKPSGGPDWGLRFVLTLLFPK